MAKHLAKLISKFSQLYDRTGITGQVQLEQGRELLIKILTELQTSPAARDEFIQYSSLHLQDPDVVFSHRDSPLQVIEFCMRKMKWPEIRVKLEQRLAVEQVRWRRERFERIISGAYLDHADGAMIWDREAYGDVPPFLIQTQ